MFADAITRHASPSCDLLRQGRLTLAVACGIEPFAVRVAGRDEGGAVGVAELVAKGAVRKNSLVKVLGDGELTVKVDLSAHKFSGSAREKITAAGGSATEL